MRAARVTRLDGPDAIEVAEVDEPTGDGVVVEVHAAGVAFPDALLTRGLYQYRPDPPFVLGARDRRGGAVGTGRRARACRRPGRRPDDADRRHGRGRGAGTRPGVQAAGQRQLRGGRRPAVQRPDGVLRADRPRPAAARARRCWCTAPPAGSGRRRCDWRRCSGASRIIAVVSTEEKAEIATAAGATDVVLADGFKDAVKELTDGRGVDIVVDPVGGDRFTDSLRSLAPAGRLLVIGFTGGEIPDGEGKPAAAQQH